jgi:hypothetical protein
MLLQARLEACYQENLQPFLEWFQSVLEMKKYKQDLIFHLDETSCQVKQRKGEKRIVAREKKTSFQLCVPPIMHMTVLFIVTASGRHLRSHAILPSSVDLSVLEEWDDQHLLLHNTTKGWMTKELFLQILQKEIIPAIVERRRLLKLESTSPALLLMDCASCHTNLILAQLLCDYKFDVVILPAHTSHLIQPLDRFVNAIFKQDLEKKQLLFPKRTELKEKLKPFLDSIENSAEKALLRPNITESFKNAEMVVVPCTARIPSLDNAPSGYKPRAVRGFPLSGAMITENEFMKKWEVYCAKRQQKKQTPSLTETPSDPEDGELSSKDDEHMRKSEKKKKQRKRRKEKKKKRGTFLEESSESSPSDLNPCIIDGDSEEYFLLPEEIARVEKEMMIELKKSCETIEIIDVDTFEIPKLEKRRLR